MVKHYSVIRRIQINILKYKIYCKKYIQNTNGMYINFHKYQMDNISLICWKIQLNKNNLSIIWKTSLISNKQVIVME